MGKVIVFNGGKNMNNNMKNNNSLKKLTEVILFFLNRSPRLIYRTKLNKLLFYAQFQTYKLEKQKLFDYEFVKDYYGPVLKNLDSYLSEIQSKGIISLNYRGYGTAVVPKIKVNNSSLTPEELSVLELISNRFEKYSSKEISDYSHQEILWTKNELGQEIRLNEATLLRELMV